MQFIWGLESCFYSYMLASSLSLPTSLYVCVCVRAHMHAHLYRCVCLHLRRAEEGIGCPPLSFSAQYLWTEGLSLTLPVPMLLFSQAGNQQVPPILFVSTTLKAKVVCKHRSLASYTSAGIWTPVLMIVHWALTCWAILSGHDRSAFMVPGQISWSASRLIYTSTCPDLWWYIVNAYHFEGSFELFANNTTTTKNSNNKL